MKFGCRVFALHDQPISQLVDLARLCEKLRFNTIVCDDQLEYGARRALAPEVFTAVTMIGLSTRKIMVGPAVTDFQRRHPAVIAQTAATINQALQGRTFLGVGLGNKLNHEPFGIDNHPSIRRLQEGMMVLRQLWQANIASPANFDGKFYKLKNAYLQVGSNTPNPKIYLAAYGERMLRLAGELADGWLPHCQTPESYKEALNGPIKKGLEKTGRTLEEFDPALYTFVAVAEDRDEARRIVEGPSRRFLSMMPQALRRIAPEIDWPYFHTSLPLADRRRFEAELASKIPSGLPFEVAISGTADDCIEQIERFRKAGCRHLIAFVLSSKGFWGHEKVKETIKLIGRKIIPYLN